MAHHPHCHQRDHHMWHLWDTQFVISEAIYCDSVYPLILDQSLAMFWNPLERMFFHLEEMYEEKQLICSFWLRVIVGVDRQFLVLMFLHHSGMHFPYVYTEALISMFPCVASLQALSIIAPIAFCVFVT